MRSWSSMYWAALGLVTACGAGWHREELAPQSHLSPRQQVQLWVGGQARVLHGVRVGVDSVTGVPFHIPLSCDSSRVAFARSAVDSMRLGSQARGALRRIGLGYAALAGAALLLYFSVDTD
jgi:hypothetical protein